MKTVLRKLALFLFSVISPAIASAQSGSFIIAQHGHSVGTATVTFTANPNGYDTTTVVKVAMQGLNYDLSKSEQLTSANAIKHVQLSATVNTSAVNITAAPDAAQFLLNISAGGHSNTTRLAKHEAAVFLPDFDPGALDTLLALGVARNNAGLWAIIPKGAGSISPIQLATYADEQGAIDGKPITVHHLKATISGAVTDLFSGPENQLLQAELPQQGFALIRKGFVLTPPARAGAPPAAQPQATTPPAHPVPPPQQ
ncbi:MAG: hypothetical protein ABR976_21850 [Terracidiphilus sp.]|jgi:hypothetical protein